MGRARDFNGWASNTIASPTKPAPVMRSWICGRMSSGRPSARRGPGQPPSRRYSALAATVGAGTSASPRCDQRCATAGRACAVPKPPAPRPRRALDTCRSNSRRGTARSGACGPDAQRLRQAGDAAHAAPLLCDPSAPGVKRHPHRVGVARARQRGHDHDLHLCAQDGRQRRVQPPGRPVDYRVAAKRTQVNFRCQS